MSGVKRSVLGSASVSIGVWMGAGGILVSSHLANASEVSAEGSIATENAMGQVTSVSQLSDVTPTDWAFQALQSLVERYGCIEGYPDRTYRGNRAITRYEFAAGLNACLDKIQQLIGTVPTPDNSDSVQKEDLETLRRLQQEFATELASLRGRVDALEVRTARLERQQFSSTTKLVGEVIFNVAGAFGDDRALDSDRWRTINAAAEGAPREAAKAAAFGADGGDVRDNPIFSDRARVNLTTSFTGKDRLYTRLEANNTTPFNSPITGTNMTRLGYDATTNLDNSVQMGKLYYQFPLGSKLSVIVDAIGGEYFSNFNTFSPYFDNPAIGAVSRFGRFSPIYRASNTGSGTNTGSGISFNYKLTNTVTLSAGYLARRASEPTESRGLFDGSYSAMAQLAFQPSKNFGVGLSYAHSYFSGVNNDVSVSGAYGSAFANQPFGAGVGNTATDPRGVPTTSNYYGIQASYRVSPKFSISAWGLYTLAIAEDGSGLANVRTGDKADIWSWSVGFAFPDLGKKGNLGGIIIGQPPKVTSNDYSPPVTTATSPRREDSDTSIHLEAIYRYQVNNNISITPGIIAILNPENDSNNDTLYVGVIRTTFRF